MEIDETINRWFEETADSINAKDNTNSPVDALCFSVVPLAHNYCNAVLILLKNNKKLPAMALLRVLGELSLRFLWCLYKDNPAKESIDVRIERWKKHTFKEGVKRLNKLLLCANPEDSQHLQDQIAFLKKEIETIGHQHLPEKSFYNSLDELPELYKKELYPRLYNNFNQAIHPDLKVFTDLMKQVGNKRIFSDDIDEVGIKSLKKHCATRAFLILSFVRLHYDLDYEGLKSEYSEIQQKLSKET